VAHPVPIKGFLQLHAIVPEAATLCRPTADITSWKMCADQECLLLTHHGFQRQTTKTKVCHKWFKNTATV